MDELIKKVFELYNAGNTPIQITKILKDSGIDTNLSDVRHMLRYSVGHEKSVILSHKNGTSNAEENKKEKNNNIKKKEPKRTKREVFTYRLVPETPIAPITKTIPQIKARDLADTKRKKIAQRAEILGMLLLSGQGIESFCKENGYGEESKKTLREMVQKLSYISLHIEQAEKDGCMEDTNFNELLKIINTEQSDTNDYSRIKGYRNKVIREIPNYRCECGKIEILRIRVFNNNNDLAAFILRGFKGINNSIRYGKDYDKKVCDKLDERYKSKLKNYLKKFGQMEYGETKRSVNKGNMQK